MNLGTSHMTDLDQPVPFTLTAKAYAATVDEWACEVCGFGWFGTRPDDGRCPDCRNA